MNVSVGGLERGKRGEASGEEVAKEVFGELYASVAASRSFNIDGCLLVLLHGAKDVIESP